LTVNSIYHKITLNKLYCLESNLWVFYNYELCFYARVDELVVENVCFLSIFINVLY